MESVYIETTIISYLVSRSSRDVVIAGHQQTTQSWWRERRLAFDCYISQAVIDEISLGDPAESTKRRSLVKAMAMLEVTRQAERLAERILESRVIPAKAVRDTTHIALATVHGIDYLLTWNCRHIANAQILRKVSEICRDEGYAMPVVCTPDELMGE